MNSLYFCLLVSCFSAAVVSGQGLCKQPIERGQLCPGGDVVRQRYGHVNGRCERFYFYGCNGNDNNFRTEAECLAACPANVCGLPLNPPATPPLDPVHQCQARFRRWGFQNGQCTSFFYHGCDKNGNHFRTEAGCKSECGGPEPSRCSDRPTTGGHNKPSYQRYYYDARSKTCRKYSSGTQNGFSSKAECEQSCVNAANPCTLPVESGRCRAYIPRWASVNGKCTRFIYGGCEGNANRFSTKEECERTCPPKVNTCTLPIERGPCQGNFRRWASVNGKCAEFVYGGCEGNANNFQSKAECEAACPVTPINVCQLPIVPGPCRGSISSWGSKDGQCVHFVYGGCQGNANRFSTKEECERACPPTASICELPIVKGPCYGSFPRWASVNGECVQFTYGGCQGNANRFSTKEECERACPPETSLCELPIVRGPCYGSFPRWASVDGKCVEFTYGGCQGNANRFSTKEACEKRCPPTNNGVCNKPIVPGPCYANIPSYGYRDGECVRFIYGGCQGNANRFSTKEACEKRCPPTTNGVCNKPIVPGPCYAYIPSYGYRDGKCIRFIYGGCQGNENRFSTKEECERRCPPTYPPTQSLCKLPLVTGPCKAYIPSYGSKNGQCVRFIYGGCQGNENRFSTKEACERRCPRTHPLTQSICEQPLVVGPCEAYIPSYGYKNGQCVRFIFGGCGGNRNKFPTKRACERFCKTKSPYY